MLQITKLLTILFATLSPSLAFGASTLSTGNAPAYVHKFEDGFVERTVAVIVRDDRAFVQYSIGLNETTIRQLLKQWDPALAKSVENDEPPRPRSEKESSTSSPTQSVHFIAPELLDEFSKQVLSKLPQQISVTYDGKPLQIESVKLGDSPRHPFTLLVEFDFPLAQSALSKLQIADSNFSMQTGAVRYAMKAVGKSMLHSSNVAPIIVRAERIELAPLDQPSRLAATTIECQLTVQPAKQD